MLKSQGLFSIGGVFMNRKVDGCDDQRPAHSKRTGLGGERVDDKHHTQSQNVYLWHHKAKHHAKMVG